MESSWENKRNERFALGIVHENIVTMQWALSLRLTSIPKDCAVLSCGSYGVDMARNKIVEMALKGGFQRLVWLDTDVCPSSNGLLNLLTSEQKFISGVYFRKDKFDITTICAWLVNPKTGEYNPIVDEGEVGLLEVDAIGGGYCCVDMDIYRNIKPPWYKYGNDGYDENGNKISGLSEDFFFCKKVKDSLGISPALDMNNRASHIGFAEYRPDGKVERPDILPVSLIERLHKMEG